MSAPVRRRRPLRVRAWARLFAGRLDTARRGDTSRLPIFATRTDGAASVDQEMVRVEIRELPSRKDTR